MQTLPPHRAVSAGALATAAVGTAIGLLVARTNAATTRPLPTLPAAAIAQLSRHGIDLTTESPAGTSSNARPVAEQTALVAAARALGLQRSDAVAASLGALTTPGMGRANSTGTVTAPEYSQQQVWAIQFADVRFPERGPPGTPLRYTADLVAFVDADSGKWLSASQYDPPTSARPPAA